MAMADTFSCEESSNESKRKSENNECPVCLQSYVHPTRLPCGHIFCFLCVKGFTNQHKKCAVCRQEISRNYLEKPILLHPPLVDPTGFDENYQWFYEGRNGWWQYDERTSKEIEISYKAGEKSCELLIAGYLYVVDFENMLQIRKCDPLRRRRIKRDHSTIPKKGIAGLRLEENCCNQEERAEELPCPVYMRERNDNVNVERVPVTPSNTPQSPTNEHEALNLELDVQISETMMRSIQLTSNSNTNESPNPPANVTSDNR